MTDFFQTMVARLESASEFLEETEQTGEQEAVDKAIEILQNLNSWCNAYPEDIFIPMSKTDWEEHHKVLEAAGRSGTAAAADSMRHVTEGFKKVLHDV